MTLNDFGPFETTQGSVRPHGTNPSLVLFLAPAQVICHLRNCAGIAQVDYVWLRIPRSICQSLKRLVGLVFAADQVGRT